MPRGRESSQEPIGVRGFRFDKNDKKEALSFTELHSFLDDVNVYKLAYLYKKLKTLET